MAEVRTYLSGSDSTGKRHYKRGTFDALPDGINNTAYTQHFFRTEDQALEAIYQWISDPTFDARFCPLSAAKPARDATAPLLS